jgi:hypothetical protein
MAAIPMCHADRGRRVPVVHARGRLSRNTEVNDSCRMLALKEVGNAGIIARSDFGMGPLLFWSPGQ